MAAKKKATKKKTAKKKAAPKKNAAPKAEPKKQEKPKAKKATAKPKPPKIRPTADTLVAGRTPENWWAVECTKTKEQGPTRADIGPAVTAFLDGERASDPVELHRPTPLIELGSGFYREATERL